MRARMPYVGTKANMRLARAKTEQTSANALATMNTSKNMLAPSIAVPAGKLFPDGPGLSSDRKPPSMVKAAANATVMISTDPTPITCPESNIFLASCFSSIGRRMSNESPL
uniref:Uncharacterized protein n=1 Tax=Arundo donax TaxID=35708 RepID=A0A0A9BCL9_ARUDO